MAFREEQREALRLCHRKLLPTEAGSNGVEVLPQPYLLHLNRIPRHLLSIYTRVQQRHAQN